MKVTASFAKAHLPYLLDVVEREESVTISRYGKPVAVLSPSPEVPKPKRKLGTLKGKIKILDPNWAAPLTNEEVNALAEAGIRAWRDDKFLNPRREDYSSLVFLEVQRSSFFGSLRSPQNDKARVNRLPKE